MQKVLDDTINFGNFSDPPPGNGRCADVCARVKVVQPRKYPQVVKYMGSKAAILDFIAAGLTELGLGDRPLVDLFAGAGAISGGFGRVSRIVSNDIQSYSAVLASAYLRRVDKIGMYDLAALAEPIVRSRLAALPTGLNYPEDEPTLVEFNRVERRNRELINSKFDYSHHLFTRVYSGTWWSAEQCVWIDAIRQVLDCLLADGKIETSDFNFGLTSLLSAMAYTSQGTGHYAQYRDAKTPTGMRDINKYRQASVPLVFTRKFDALLKWHLDNVVDDDHELIAMDYRMCLGAIKNAVVYADPPYAFVHYSRFYHAMETLVKYDYPVLQCMAGGMVKGRYRSDRHQSPFCIKSQVRGAFLEMFSGVLKSGSDLLLSYSNTGMIDIEVLIQLASTTFGDGYDVWYESMGHTHMTMGRSNDRSRAVTESLIMARKK